MAAMLTVREVAKRVHKNPETVRRWIWDGKLKASKLGNQLFIEEGELSKVNRRTPEEIEEQLRLLDRIAENARRIHDYRGDIDVVQWLEESRASHP